MTRPYIYRVTEVVKVTDGDTYWLRLDVGFRQTLLVNLRLLGYDCPERTRGSERERQLAKAATATAEQFFRFELEEGMRRPCCVRSLYQQVQLLFLLLRLPSR